MIHSGPCGSSGWRKKTQLSIYHGSLKIESAIIGQLLNLIPLTFAKACIIIVIIIIVIIIKCVCYVSDAALRVIYELCK